MPYTIALIEDNATFAAILTSCINQDAQLQVVNTYKNKEEAMQLKEHSIDLVIVDIQLPDGNGVDIVAALQPQMPDTKFIMCTSFDDDDKIFKSLKAGAVGYIIKTDEAENIVTHIHDALTGGAPMSAGIALRVVKYFQELNKPKHLNELTNKENVILQSLAKGMYYKEIAEAENLSIDTIKKHCCSIYRKLHVSNRTEAINLLNKK
jgi:two-component system, NarL family, response regulator LiaR